jgi:nucleoid-associated protein YgaU
MHHMTNCARSDEVADEPSHEPFSQEVVDAVARRFRVLGTPSRLRILNQLLERPRSMSELQELCGLEQSNLSRRVAELEQAGCVRRRRSGRQVVVEVAARAVPARVRVAEEAHRARAAVLPRRSRALRRRRRSRPSAAAALRPLVRLGHPSRGPDGDSRGAGGIGRPRSGELGMRTFRFARDAGLPLFGRDALDPAIAGGAEPSPAQRVAQLERIVRRGGLEVGDLHVELRDDTIVLQGRVAGEADRERIVLLVGNTIGVSEVEDRLESAEEAEAGDEKPRFHSVQVGETLPDIAQRYLGRSSRYPAIFEANRPMLTRPDRIYPGQVLRIPRSGREGRQESAARRGRDADS